MSEKTKIVAEKLVTDAILNYKRWYKLQQRAPPTLPLLDGILKETQRLFLCFFFAKLNLRNVNSTSLPKAQAPPVFPKYVLVNFNQNDQFG